MSNPLIPGNLYADPLGSGPQEHNITPIGKIRQPIQEPRIIGPTVFRTYDKCSNTIAFEVDIAQYIQAHTHRAMEAMNDKINTALADNIINAITPHLIERGWTPPIPEPLDPLEN